MLPNSWPFFEVIFLAKIALNLTYRYVIFKKIKQEHCHVFLKYIGKHTLFLIIRQDTLKTKKLYIGNFSTVRWKVFLLFLFLKMHDKPPPYNPVGPRDALFESFCCHWTNHRCQFPIATLLQHPWLFNSWRLHEIAEKSHIVEMVKD